MALIPCPDCGRMVSPAATTCPECGRPFAWARGAGGSGPKPRKKGGDLRLMGGLMLLATAGTFLLDMPPIVFFGCGVMGLILYVAGRIVGGS